MLARTFKRTKIVATIGPSSNSPQALEQILLAGANGLRLNFSHGTHEEHGAVVELARGLAAKHERPVAIIGDLQGPKIRVGILPTDGLPFVRGHVVRFQHGAEYDKNGVIPVQHDVSRYLKPGERIFLRDGQIEIDVEKVEKTLITGKVEAPGLLFTNQGMNLPDTDLGGDILTDKDIADIEFIVKNDVDYVALSFVQTAQDILNLKERLKKLKADVKVIAKIETAAAVENLEEIFAATDGVMMARGDLAIETKPEAVPAVQRRMVELAKHHRKPVIVATQMLESMIQSQSPTRAEVSDVATAVIEGADAVMLSGESAMGLFPVEAVAMMKRVILATEEDQLAHWAATPRELSANNQPNAISSAAVVLAAQVPAKVIIAETATGQTALNISSLRPAEPIVMVTDRKRVHNQLAIVWGGKSYLHGKPAEAADHVMRQLRLAGNVKPGDAVVVASGDHPGVPGGTSTVSIRIVQ
jgi:pyruvate kinase